MLTLASACVVTLLASLVLKPIWVVFAALWFGETLAALQWIGCLMIFLALLVNRWRVLRSLVARRGI